jgi:8-oxo-dGTP pyrophosphatase MutT (NUDIX family)
LKQLIERRLKGTRPPVDPVAAALERLPNGFPRTWFRRPLVSAAVLVPLIERGSEMKLLLTQRTEHLNDHPGQISFPGGRCEPTDAGARYTALRETQEEIGLAAESIAVVGYLEPVAVVTGFAVAPVVGFIAADAKFTPDPFEVAEVFEVPFEFFLDDANHQLRERTVRGVTMPFSEYLFEERRIWGATAMMIRDFTNLIQCKNS